MGEQLPKPQHTAETESGNQRLELIHTKFDRDPTSHLFSAIWDFDIDITYLTDRRNPSDKERREATKSGDSDALRQFRPVITSGNQLLQELFTQIEFMQPPERLKAIEEGKNELLHANSTDNAESNNFIYESLDRIITLHKSVRTELNTATDIYYSNEYWEDPMHKRGLKTNNIELLYDHTQPYEEQGLLKALDEIDDSRAFSQDIMFEAKRIARILVARENDAI